MSIENAKVFLEKLKEDSGLVEQLKALPQDDPDTWLGEMIKIAQAKGCEFSTDDWTEANCEQEGASLSDEQLEKVAGGNARTIWTEFQTCLCQ